MSLRLIYLLGMLMYISIALSLYFIYDMITTAYKHKTVKYHNFFYGLASWLPTFILMFFMKI